MLTVIDVSRHQGAIDWKAVAESGIRAAIIRCGYGDNVVSQDDSRWEDNYRGAIANGIKVGTYLYSYALSVKQAESEALHLARLVAGKTIEFGVWYDLEDPTQQHLGGKVLGDFAETFASKVEELTSHKVGIYANKYWFTSILTDARFNNYDKWVAQYASECTYQGAHVGWQYTSTGRIPGISGNVDISEFYVDVQDKTEPSKKDVPSLKGYAGVSIAGALNSVGYPSDFGYRSELAKLLGIKSYKGTAEQNLKMIELLGGTVKEMADDTKWHTVQSGETLSSIAKKYGTTWKKLQQANHIANANLIYPGQRLRIV